MSRYISYPDQYQLQEMYYSSGTIFFISLQYMCPKILKTHLPRFWPSYATVSIFLRETNVLFFRDADVTLFYFWKNVQYQEFCE